VKNFRTCGAHREQHRGQLSGSKKREKGVSSNKLSSLRRDGGKKEKNPRPDHKRKWE